MSLGTLDDSGNIATIKLYNSSATTVTKLQDYEAADTKNNIKHNLPHALLIKIIKVRGSPT